MKIKHKYKVKCLQCGFEKINNDSGTREDVELVTVSYCHKCQPNITEVRAITFHYDKNGEKIYNSDKIHK